MNYVDWSGDARHDPVARRILKATTQVSVEDLQWRPDFNAYLNRHMPATVQQAATIFGLRESVLRGVAEKGWEELAKKFAAHGRFQGNQGADRRTGRHAG